MPSRRYLGSLDDVWVDAGVPSRRYLEDLWVDAGMSPIGVDQCLDMHNDGKTLVQPFVLRGLVRFVRGSILELASLGLAPFNLINCVGVLMILPDPAVALRMLRRWRRRPILC